VARTVLDKTAMGQLITDDIAAFAAAVPPAGRLMGVDLGTKTVGLALSDVTQMIASPFETLKRGKFSTVRSALEAHVAAHGVIGFVVGLPKNMDDTSGPRVQASRAFARNVADALSCACLMWDERLTTAEAERMLISADASRRRRAEVVDQVAATLILQGAMDRLAAFRRAPMACDEAQC